MIGSIDAWLYIGHHLTQPYRLYTHVFLLLRAVINALSDLHHPLQALADMLTLQVGTFFDKRRARGRRT